ncbi:MAG: hypothetical protein ACFFD4_31355 [Candidatus Odinarchaeota archaeon]
MHLIVFNQPVTNRFFQHPELACPRCATTRGASQRIESDSIVTYRVRTEHLPVPIRWDGGPPGVAVGLDYGAGPPTHRSFPQVGARETDGKRLSLYNQGERNLPIV